MADETNASEIVPNGSTCNGAPLQHIVSSQIPMDDSVTTTETGALASQSSESIWAPANSDACEQPQSSSIEIGDSLNELEYPDLLRIVAETNHPTRSWDELRQAIKAAVIQQCEIMNTKIAENSASRETIEGLRTSIIHAIDRHERPPFTIQRLCELVTYPRRHYRMFIKYLNAVEKVLFVTSSWDGFQENMDTMGGSSRPLEESSILGILGQVETEAISHANGTGKDDDEITQE
ncbi:PPP4R2-domain-containing protein [Dichotomocladium elegans]|nr:PPP4R2-domain-containing protein [Dichotomocladium elegans]